MDSNEDFGGDDELDEELDEGSEVFDKEDGEDKGTLLSKHEFT